VELIILTLATYRLSQIVAQDTITQPLRERISKHGAPPEDLNRLRRWLAYLIHCVLCVSVWAGLGLAILLSHDQPIGYIFTVGLAASGGAVVLGSILATLNKRGGS